MIGGSSLLLFAHSVQHPIMQRLADPKPGVFTQRPKQRANRGDLSLPLGVHQHTQKAKSGHTQPGGDTPTLALVDQQKGIGIQSQCNGLCLSSIEFFLQSDGQIGTRTGFRRDPTQRLYRLGPRLPLEPGDLPIHSAGDTHSAVLRSKEIQVTDGRKIHDGRGVADHH